MNCKPTNIKITEGNAFALICPIRSIRWQGVSPIEEDIDPAMLQEVEVKVNGVSWSDFEATEQGIVIAFPATLKQDTYNVEISAKYNDIAIRVAYFEVFTIVAWSYQSDAENYVPNSPLVAEAAYCVAGNWTDEELDELKADYRAAIAEAEAAKEAADEAKEEYIEKAEQLDGVAQQATLENVQNKVGTPASGQPDTLFGAIANITIDTSTIAKQGTNASATLTATQTAATNAYASAEAAKTGVVDGNDTAISVTKEIRSEVGTGSDTAAETGTLFAVVKWVKDKVKSIYNALTDGTSGLSAIKQAILDNAGTPTMTIPNTTASQELAPNTLYIFASRSAALTLTLDTPIVGVANEYHLFLVTDSATAPTITWPAGISWNGGSAPTIATSKTYEVSILNNVAAYFEV